MSPGSRPIPETRPASRSTTPTTAITTPITISIRPRSDIGLASVTASLKERALAGASGRWLPLQMRVGLARHAAAARLAGDEPDLEQVRFHDLRECFRLVVDRGRHGLQAHGPALVDVHDGLEEAAVELVEPPGVHALAREGSLRNRLRDHAVRLDLGIVAHPPQQAVGDARRAARAPRDLAGAGGVHAGLQDRGRAGDD